MAITYTPRQRFQKIMAHQEADRVPLDLGGTSLTSADSQVWDALRQAFGFLPQEDTSSAYDERILAALDVDFRRVGSLIASGWQTCGVAMRLACAAVLDGSEAYASPGVEKIRWPNPVRAGDPLSFRAEVLEIRRSTKRPELGVLRWKWELFHIDGRQALEMDATSLFKLPVD